MDDAGTSGDAFLSVTRAEGCMRQLQRGCVFQRSCRVLLFAFVASAGAACADDDPFAGLARDAGSVPRNAAKDSGTSPMVDSGGSVMDSGQPAADSGTMSMQPQDAGKSDAGVRANTADA